MYSITTTHRNVALALSRDGFVYVFIPYKEPLNISSSLSEKKEDPISSLLTTGTISRLAAQSIPKIIYYDSKNESKAREIQRLIKPFVSIETVELASTTNYSYPSLLYNIPLSWQIEVSF